MKVKSILVKSAAVAALSISSVALMNSTKADTVQAATVENDATVVTVNYVDGNSINVWNSYDNPVATGQVLPSNSSWKVIKTAYDANGEKWYDLGKNQWVRAKFVNPGNTPADSAQSEQTSAATSENTVDTTSNSTTQSYVATTTDSDSSAKAWIANRESGGSYSAQNGQYIGKYQLSASYLNGDYSAANQERVADNYVSSRYGSWAAAKAFWQANGWY
ncbi:SLAP domain-containing protein [Lactobacillus sp. ESL0684]|uniref:aggregation-promoting factor n=1 Tax=Lactobacillus sp. ESL0684 TaxID=2983213 RepID=UPI0023F9D6BE|nr:SLAP domain-containing protein [Lactobacillus sp. ESL0684]WEV43321.1 SLAP domain-containing protein [Lactobacillus sp. ESL0684]